MDLCPIEFVGLILKQAWDTFALVIANKWAEGEQKSVFSKIGCILQKIEFSKTGTFDGISTGISLT